MKTESDEECAGSKASGRRGLAPSEAASPVVTAVLKHLGKIERQHGVEPLVAGNNGFVLGVQRHAAGLLEHTFGSSNLPPRRNISIVVDAPDADESQIRSQSLASPHRGNNPPLGAVDGERPADTAQLTLRTANHSLGLDVAIIGAIEDSETLTALPSTSNNQQVMDRIHSHRAGAQFRVRPFENADGSYIAVGIAGEHQHGVPLGNKNFAMHRVRCETFRIYQLRLGALKDSDRGFLAIGRSPESEDGLGERDRN